MGPGGAARGQEAGQGHKGAGCHPPSPSILSHDPIPPFPRFPAARGKTPSQVALNWLLHRPGVTAPIMGVRTLAQLEENLGCLGWALSADEVAQLDSVSAVPLPSPYNFIERYTRKRP